MRIVCESCAQELSVETVSLIRGGEIEVEVEKCETCWDKATEEAEERVREEYDA